MEARMKIDLKNADKVEPIPGNDDIQLWQRRYHWMVSIFMAEEDNPREPKEAGIEARAHVRNEFSGVNPESEVPEWLLDA